MAITARVQHCFQGNGGTSKDMYCNQFYFWHPTETAATAATWGPPLASKVHQFWDQPSPTLQVCRYYSGHAFGNGGKTTIYDAATPGPPIFTISDDALTGGTEYLTDLSGYASSATKLPLEVAVCLSYQAAHTDGNLPRRRGRIYLGPLNVGALDDTVGDTNQPAVSNSFITTILNAALFLQDAANDAGWKWRVYSQMDGFAFDIINFSVDNDFDTVRGRGPRAQYRQTVAVP